jgi:DNA-binding NarL/FixJ family response regulator
VIRVALADDQVLVRAGFRALLDAEVDVEIAGEASTVRTSSHSCAASPSTSCSWTSGCRRRWPLGNRADRRRPEARRVHVVIVTTFELDEYVARAIRAGRADSS